MMDEWKRIADAMAIVWRVYRAELQRDPDPDCAGWVAEIATGHMTEAQMVAAVRTTDEWAALHQEPAVPVPPQEPGPQPQPTPAGRTGRVRLDGKVMADDEGPWLALGASLFWAVRGARTEPERLRQNLRWLRQQGVDFVRVFAETSDWPEESRTDPRWPDYESALRTCRDLSAAEGLRIAWTVFGGNALTGTEQNACAETLRRVCNERPETVQYVEVSNENNGCRGDVGFLRAVARAFADAGYVAALTSAAHVKDAYQGSAANVATVHFERTLGDRGWRPVRQPWGYPGEYGEGLPATFISGEPIGPGSSVATESDPEKLAMNAVHTWLCGGCAHVVHFGAGIYGVQTSHPVGGNRPPDVWNQDGLAATLARIAHYRAQLPADLPNWQRTRHALSDHPFRFPPDELQTVGDGALTSGQGCVRAYAAHAGGRYVCAVIGIMGNVVLAPQHTDGLPFSLAESDGPTRLLFGRYV
jgi:hypothetical protein